MYELKKWEGSYE